MIRSGLPSASRRWSTSLASEKSRSQAERGDDGSAPGTGKPEGIGADEAGAVIIGRGKSGGRIASDRLAPANLVSPFHLTSVRSDSRKLASLRLASVKSAPLKSA